jgi:hypothetical protein
MFSIVLLILGLLPPLLTGPLAGIAFITILKREKLWYQLPFWLLLMLFNLLIMLWIATSSGFWLPIASLSSFFFTPIASILTVFVMRHAWRKLESSTHIEKARKRWFMLGLVLIPVLQMAAFVALIIYAPCLCKTGFLVCPDLPGL